MRDDGCENGDKSRSGAADLNPRSAEKRRDEVAAQGFEPKLEPRTEQASQWWIDLAGEPGLAWREALGGGAGLEARPVACR